MINKGSWAIGTAWEEVMCVLTKEKKNSTQGEFFNTVFSDDWLPLWKVQEWQWVHRWDVKGMQDIQLVDTWGKMSADNMEKNAT